MRSFNPKQVNVKHSKAGFCIIAEGIEINVEKKKKKKLQRT